MRAERDGDARVAFRFFPTMRCQKEGYEEACGTGTIAVGIAMLQNGDIDVRDGEAEVPFEVGSAGLVDESQRVTTMLRMTIRHCRVIDAEFSHSSIEIVAWGKART
ncbi:MAG: hypothetical protein ACOC6F_03840, partial [bacterium]